MFLLSVCQINLNIIARSKRCNADRTQWVYWDSIVRAVFHCVYTHTQLGLPLCVHTHTHTWGFPRSSVGKESACSVRDLGLIPGSGRFSGEGDGSPLQYSCLENPMDRGAWRATVHGVTRVTHDLASKPPPYIVCWISYVRALTWLFNLNQVFILYQVFTQPYVGFL